MSDPVTDEEAIKEIIGQWSMLCQFWHAVLMNRIAETKAVEPGSLTDQQIVERVSDLAWAMAADERNVMPFGTRMDRSHQPFCLEKWKQAVALFKKACGIDAQEALARHEAEIRNAQNAPELHIERR